MKENRDLSPDSKDLDRYGKRIIKAVVASGSAYALGRTAQNLFQLKYDLGNATQYFHELGQGINAGTISTLEAVGLIPISLCCLVPIGILGLVLNRARKK